MHAAVEIYRSDLSANGVFAATAAASRAWLSLLSAGSAFLSSNHRVNIMPPPARRAALAAITENENQACGNRVINIQNSKEKRGMHDEASSASSWRRGV